MRRSRKVLAVCHCLLNQNAKVLPLAAAPGVLPVVLDGFLAQGAGLVQLPCPETAVLGLSRWGMTREQYDTPFLRRSYSTMLQPIVDQLVAFQAFGCELLGLVGVDGSPSCGVFATCEGFAGGEPCAAEADLPGQCAALRMVQGRGVFVEVFLELCAAAGLNMPHFAVDERHPGDLIRP